MITVSVTRKTRPDGGQLELQRPLDLRERNSGVEQDVVNLKEIAGAAAVVDLDLHLESRLHPFPGLLRFRFPILIRLFFGELFGLGLLG